MAAKHRKNTKQNAANSVPHTKNKPRRGKSSTQNGRSLPNDQLLMLIIALFGLLLYGNTIFNGYSFDDTYNTPLEERVAKGIRGIPEILTTPYLVVAESERRGDYRPVTMISYAIESDLFGENPGISHFINVLLYMLTGILLFLVFCNLFKQYHRLFPFLATLLFMAHPMHTEVVASLKNREEILSLLFALWSMLLFLRHYSPRPEVENSKQSLNKIGLLAVALLLYTLAFFSKAGSVTFGLLIPLSLYLFKGMNGKKALAWAVPLTILPFVVMLLINMSFESGYGTKIYYTENPLHETSGLGVRLSAVFYSLAYYVKMALLPYPMLFYYGTGKLNPIGWGNPITIISAIGHLAALAFALYHAYNRKRKTLSYGILYYLIALSIYVNLVAVMAGIVADRYLYNATAGLAILVVWGLSKSLKTDIENSASTLQAKHWRLVGAMLLLLLPCALLTIMRNPQWTDTLTLLQSDIKYLEKSAVPQYLLGQEWLNQADSATDPATKHDYAQRSLKRFKQTVKLHPGNPAALRNMGYIKCDIFNEPQDAIKYYKAALALDPENATTNYNAGNCYKLANDDINSLRAYEKYLTKQADDASLMAKMIAQYCKTGDLEKAANLITEIEKHKPDSEELYLGGGTYHLCRGDTLKATQNFEAVIAKNPKATKLAGIVAQYYYNKGNMEKAQYYMKLAKKQ